MLGGAKVLQIWQVICDRKVVRKKFSIRKDSSSVITIIIIIIVSSVKQSKKDQQLF